ncbi:hypothetical protein [Metabacillus malikii]|uniref:Uncharacterized protein n=1 Tax=Metabacillus malikii TaxID=1504265 RepID=A0ABT9ZHB1_9BACI|nr:hypothetical protein [Metabacillus malikii]MDQ0230928.1 hypothetical protein [Metabacillus malikii]
MIKEKVFIDRLVGAINTCIRLINESDKSDVVGKGIIDNEWQSYINKNDDSFVAILTILNKKQAVEFKVHEWLRVDVNIHANDKLNALIKSYTR